MRKLLILVAAGSTFLAIFAGNAAELVSPAGSPPPEAASAPPAAGPRRVSQIAPTGAPIVLESGKGTLIKLDRPAATVFIANPDVADVQVKSPSLIYLNAKQPGETVLYAVDANDNVLLNAPIRVGHDLSRLRQSFRSLMPGEDIDVNSIDNSVVLSGKVSSAGRAEKARNLAATIAGETKGSVFNEMSVATPNQVNLRVKVAEINRTVLKAIGVNWAKTTGVFQFVTQNPVTGQNITAQNILSYAFRLPGNMGQLQATLDALAQENLLTTLAEPNLTATSGQTASFLAGGEFPIPVASTAANTNGFGTITVAFKKFGVSLDFTPTIIDANHLSLKIRPEVSQLSSNGAVQITGFSIPALTVRRAETTVELGSGESFALAGLLQNTSSQSVSRLPWLGDIPILGQLFRSDQFQRNESELIIIVTPYLVKPSATVLAAPTDGFVPPHDAERIINSKTYRQALPAPPNGPVPRDGQGLIGPVGFRLD